MQTFKIVISIVFLLFWGFLSEYFFMPALAISASSGIYWNLLICSIVLFLISKIEDDSSRGNPISYVFGFTGVIAIFALIIGIFTSWEMFNAEDYRKLIGTIQETEFTSNVQAISPHQMLVVDKEIARRIGEKEVGSDPGLGSRVEVGEFTLQAVKGQLYWIAPLEHTGYWKWNRFGNEGTPGYIRVSATNQDDYALVREVDGKPVHIIYQTGAFFSQDLERYIYTHGYRSELFGDMTFEVDDEWHPFWTVTIYDTKIGLSGYDAIAVMTVNPETGEIKRYSIADAPAWIDRIQSSSVVNSQIDDWGNYVHGWWNWSGSDIIRVASESSLVLGSDGHSYFYYGLTSAGNDKSTVGFVMVDTRSKKAHWFKQSGATEDAAKKSAEGKIQEKGYTGSDGVTYNIDGHATYEFLLKDKGGLMKQIALVNVHDHTIVGIGENRQEALQDYRAQMLGRGNNVSISTSDMETVDLTARIIRFGTETVKGTTYYYFVLSKKSRVEFTAAGTISTELVLTQVNDSVRIKYIEPNSDGIIPVDYFDNLNLGITKDSIQVKNEARFDSVRTEQTMKSQNGVVDNKIENLTPEQKKKALKLLQK
ncbi:MAG: hypothetical protein WCG20_02695 [bacterium]